MLFIAHRGNVFGSSPKENEPDYVLDAITRGFNVEIDVWSFGEKFFLGHDGPVYPIDKEFLTHTSLWCHAKNLEALNKMMDLDCVCFWHEEDKATLTSNGYIWTYPGQQTYHNSICCMPTPEQLDSIISGKRDFHGLCCDYVGIYQKALT